MNLRKHQLEFASICGQIRNGAPIKRIVCNCGPGSGKSLLPMIAAAELGLKIIWLVPRTSLQTQAEETFQDPALRELCGYTGSGIRKSTNEKNPARSLDGFVTTYQALALDKGDLEKEIHSKPYALILDENNHLFDEAAAVRTLLKLSTHAVLTVLMSGTQERHDGKRISFLDYKVEQDGEEERDILDFASQKNAAVITYGRQAALADKAIIPIRATYLDAKASWTKGGKTVEVESLKYVNGPKASRALFTALKTEYAIQLLNECVTDWLLWRDNHPRSKLLVVAARQDEAKRFAEHLKKQGITCAVAIEQEGPKSQKSIKAFRLTPQPMALVSVQMCHEGLDAPAITHIACLTRVRSRPWIEQMIARATRFDKHAGPWEDQTASIFCPDDMKMRKIIGLIEKEQIQFNIKKPKSDSVPTGGTRDLFGDIIPISSKAHGKRSQRLFSGATAPVVSTPSEQERDIRDQIERHIRSYAARKKIEPAKLNGKVKAKFGKSRTEMTLAELERVKVFVEGSMK